MESKLKSLTPKILHIVKDKGTEPPFSSINNKKETIGTYICRQCGLALFRSHSKFNSGCGWPSFDEEIPHSITVQQDADTIRTEIICAQCHSHLGHVFSGENFTVKNIRHCVNSISLEFVEDNKVTQTQEAIFAAGCFWGVEYFLKKIPGVLKTQVGYTGGNTINPTYKEICYKNTGHLEAIRVVYNPTDVSYEKLVQQFFEIHDPTQLNGQGPDIGEQYLSAIFYYNEQQMASAKKLITELQNKGLNVATTLYPVTTFWPAEDDHQDYYNKSGGTPYCHFHTPRF